MPTLNWIGKDGSFSISSLVLARSVLFVLPSSLWRWQMDGLEFLVRLSQR